MPPENEHILTVLLILGFCAVVAYRLILWVINAPRTPDPWDKDIEEAVNREDAVVLCHHCLTPQEHNGWFCPNCGATVGPYCNYMPYVYVFSQGEVLRAGVTERLRRNPLITIGFVLFSISIFAIAAPVYWFFLFRNLRRNAEAQPEGPPAAS